MQVYSGYIPHASDPGSADAGCRCTRRRVGQYPSPAVEDERTGCGPLKSPKIKAGRIPKQPPLQQGTNILLLLDGLTLQVQVALVPGKTPSSTSDPIHLHRESRFTGSRSGDETTDTGDQRPKARPVHLIGHD